MNKQIIYDNTDNIESIKFMCKVMLLAMAFLIGYKVITGSSLI